jgi:predicted GNAT superfamily acetyltransferase
MVRGAVPGVGADRARAVADGAARAAGIDIRPAESLADFRLVQKTLDAVFGIAPGESEASIDLLVAFAHTGQYLVLARDARAGGRPVLGTSLGFFCAPDRSTLHSHATAVLQAGRDRHVGWALKLHQRTWTMVRGLDTITWTFDPLIRRNAWFNLAKLAATPTAFEVDFYGAIMDAVNAGDESDRLFLAWQLRAERVAVACDGAPLVASVADMIADGAPRLLEIGPGERPSRSVLPRGADCGLVQVPSDIESMRTAEPALALRWRRELRSVLTEVGDRGLGVVSVGRDGWYVLGRKSPDGLP